MTWIPDLEAAESAMQEIHKSVRERYQPVFVRDGEFVGIYCKTCGKEYLRGHDKYCSLLFAEEKKEEERK